MSKLPIFRGVGSFCSAVSRYFVDLGPYLTKVMSNFADPLSYLAGVRSYFADHGQYFVDHGAYLATVRRYRVYHQQYRAAVLPYRADLPQYAGVEPWTKGTHGRWGAKSRLRRSHGEVADEVTRRTCLESGYFSRHRPSQRCQSDPAPPLSPGSPQCNRCTNGRP